ncbi:alternative ribosome rescue aminoacyl-tRNA hydrolase ArfB [Planctomicrobium sp. SH668]|uniref:alternative ribosome rescue aminoacyl-tRNA hydrolase ArfB n=1 Tax=Planctomicrobium sp. SH668 TaxID=3448126 RepID=UPI003F5AF1D6
MNAERPTLLIVTETLSVPTAELQFTYVRSSGPGGQNVNKVSSQVQLSWDLTLNESLPIEVMERLRESERGRLTKAGVLRMDCQRYRDREKNIQDCFERLRQIILQVAHPPKKRKKTRVSRGAIERRLKNKQLRAGVKQSRRRLRLDD